MDNESEHPEQLTPLQRRRRRRVAAQQAAQQQGEPEVRVIEVAPAARPASMRLRHWMLVLSFVVVVVAPVAGAGYYLYTHAADQYASRVGFTVRREESGSAFEILGGLTDLSSSSSSDTDILYEYIESQELVLAVDEMMDLRYVYSKPQNDPVFSLSEEGPVEELMEYWQRMVRVFYAPSTGLIQVEVRAFDPQDARAITQAIFDKSSEMINELSAIAAEDTTRYAKEELDEAVNRLKEARLELTRFRNENQIVDPQADLQGQMGLLNNLQAELASALIELDLLAETTRPSDPRVAVAERKIEVIQSRIADERRKLGVSSSAPGMNAFADLVGRYESLQVDREFAEKAYLSALSAYDAAVAEARRRSRYLAAYVKPTLADSPEYPRRPIILGILAAMLFGLWCLIALISYSLKDRR